MPNLIMNPDASQPVSTDPWSTLSRILFEVAKTLSATVMPFLRRCVGYRIYGIGVLLLLMCLMAVSVPGGNSGSTYGDPRSEIIWLYNSHRPPRPLCLFLFSALSLGLALREKGRRWKEFKRGMVVTHSYDRGTSVLSFLGWNYWTLVCIIDPLVCVLSGLLCWYALSTALGLWLVVAGLALHAVETSLYRKALARERALLSATFDSRRMASIVPLSSTNETSPSIPAHKPDPRATQTSPDIDALIARKRGAWTLEPTASRWMKFRRCSKSYATHGASSCHRSPSRQPTHASGRRHLSLDERIDRLVCRYFPSKNPQAVAGFLLAGALGLPLRHCLSVTKPTAPVVLCVLGIILSHFISNICLNGIRRHTENPRIGGLFLARCGLCLTVIAYFFYGMNLWMQSMKWIG